MICMGLTNMNLGCASRKRTGGSESKRGEAGAENDSSAARNTDDLDPSSNNGVITMQQCWEACCDGVLGCKAREGAW